MPCRICGSKSTAFVKIKGQKCCPSCATPVPKERRAATEAPPPVRCPRCESLKLEPRRDGWFQCSVCQALFDPTEEVGFLDTRPERNAIKREERAAKRPLRKGAR